MHFFTRLRGQQRARQADALLADDLEDLVLLQGLARDVERQVLRVDDALDEVEVLRDEIVAVVHDEDAADVELRCQSGRRNASAP